jgi:hypothetical protein
MEEISAENEENLNSLMRLQEENDLIFIKDSFERIKSNGKKVKIKMSEKKEQMKIALKKIKDKIFEDVI